MKSLLILLASLIIVNKSMGEEVTIFTNEHISISQYPRKVSFSGLYNSHAAGDDNTLVLRLNKSTLNPPDYDNVLSISFADMAFADMFNRRPLEYGERMTVIAQCSGPYNLLSYVDSYKGPSIYNYNCQIASMTVEKRDVAAAGALPRQPASLEPEIKKDPKQLLTKGGLASK